MDNKLISMTDFVLSLNKIGRPYSENYHNCILYANFLKQPLTLGMFVPVNSLGNVISDKYDSRVDDPNKKLYQLVNEYNEVKFNVLFEGFEIRNREMNKIELSDSGNVFWIKEKSSMCEDEFGTESYIYTIEDLTRFDLQLTESALKQIQS